ncbi:MAG: hypothetical protein GY866_30035 [Proteobacteria bacterium]|nr:hypothetical protein [Pseudomonadota bacterium]
MNIMNIKRSVLVMIAGIIIFVLTSDGFSDDNVKAATEISGRKIEVKVKAGKYWKDKWPIFLFIQKTTTPQVAIWIEDTKGNFLETIYVSKKAATQGWVGMGDIRRKSSLPYWAHRRGKKYQDGIYLPTSDDPLPDALTGATPVGDFTVNMPNRKMISDSIKVFAEFNSSGNFNEDYPEDDFFGQPSVVYSSIINLTEPGSSTQLKLSGHGHPKGDNGKLFSDLSTLTTALKIVDEVTVELKRMD